MTLLFSMPGGTEWFIIFFVLGLMIIPKIFYIITLQNTLEAISLPNRKMASGNVWLLLIPLFGIVWHFTVVNKVADSIRAEADMNGIKINENRPGYNIGLAMCILNCFFFIPTLNIFTWMAAVVCWIIYWSTISGYKNQILNESGIDNIGVLNSQRL